MHDTDLKRVYRDEGFCQAFSVERKVWSRDKITSIILQEVQKRMKLSVQIDAKTNLFDYFDYRELTLIKVEIFKNLSKALSINVNIPPKPTTAEPNELPQQTVAEFSDEIFFAMNNPQESKIRR